MKLYDSVVWNYIYAIYIKLPWDEIIMSSLKIWILTYICNENKECGMQTKPNWKSIEFAYMYMHINWTGHSKEAREEE